MSHLDTDPGSVNALKKDMLAWDVKPDSGLLSSSECDEFAEARLMYFKAESHQAQLLKQKSCVRWAVDGDKNSAFFHRTIRGRMKRNAIKGILVNGVWMEDAVKVKIEIFEHFKRQFSESSSARPSFTSSNFLHVDE